jgi:mRNA interferase HicA
VAAAGVTIYNKYVAFYRCLTQHECCIFAPPTRSREPHGIQRVQKITQEPGAPWFTPAKGSHFRVTLNGRTTIFPDHGSREIGKGLVEQIKKQLGLK